jgi:hypothetical protein
MDTIHVFHNKPDLIKLPYSKVLFLKKFGKYTLAPLGERVRVRGIRD